MAALTLLLLLLSAAKAEAIARDEYGMVNSLHEYGECADAIRAMKEHQ